MNKKGKKAATLDDLLYEMGQVRKLLVLQLVISGVQTKDIATALGVDKSVVSRMVPTRKIRKPAD